MSNFFLSIFIYSPECRSLEHSSSFRFPQNTFFISQGKVRKLKLTWVFPTGILLCSLLIMGFTLLLRTTKEYRAFAFVLAFSWKHRHEKTVRLCEIHGYLGGFWKVLRKVVDLEPEKHSYDHSETSKGHVYEPYISNVLSADVHSRSLIGKQMPCLELMNASRPSSRREDILFGIRPQDEIQLVN